MVAIKNSTFRFTFQDGTTVDVDGQLAAATTSLSFYQEQRTAPGSHNILIDYDYDLLQLLQTNMKIQHIARDGADLANANGKYRRFALAYTPEDFGDESTTSCIVLNVSETA